MTFFIALFIFSFIVSGLCSWIIYLYGPVFGFMDIANGRSSHCGAIPTGAGIGLLLSYVIISVYLHSPVTVWLPVMTVSLFSFIGDRNELSVKSRLFVQFFCAVTVCIGWYLNAESSHFFLLFFFVFFIMGTANMYNFMDGINGLAGLTAVIGFGFLIGYGMVNHVDQNLVFLNIVLCGASMGFLFFNFPRAIVFMGDVGSIFIGFFFAVQVIRMSSSFADFLCMTSFILPFYLDEVTTMVLRLKNKENLTKAHRKHMYQLLANELSIPQWKITSGFAVFQILIGLVFFLIQSENLFYLICAYVFFGMAFIATTFLIRKHSKIIQ